MASGYKTGGRQIGTPNKKTAEKLAAIIDGGITPLEYMLKILRDETTSPERRDEMAKAAAPYCHPRLTALEHSGETQQHFAIVAPRQARTTEEWVSNLKKTSSGVPAFTQISNKPHLD